MKVKICDVLYDSADFPIMLILTAKEKLNIVNMPAEATKYASFPSDIFDVRKAEEWMKKEGEDNHGQPVCVKCGKTMNLSQKTG